MIFRRYLRCYLSGLAFALLVGCAQTGKDTTTHTQSQSQPQTEPEPQPPVVKAPATIEDGNKTPFAVMIPQGIGKNDRVVIKVANEQVTEVTVTDNVKLTYVSVRVRMLATGRITAEIFRSGVLETTITSNPIDVKKPAFIPKSAKNKNDKRMRVKNNKVQLIYDNKMAEDSYVRTVSIHTADGDVVFNNTTLMGALPFFSVGLESHLGEVSVTPTFVN